MTNQGPSAGWYPDPSGSSSQRYFDGATWTQHTYDAPPTIAPPQLPATANQYWLAPAVPPSNSLATASLVLGILAAVIEWGGILTFSAGVLAVVFGAIGISRAKRLHVGRSKAVAGLILGCVGICAYIFWGLLTFGVLWII